MTTSEDARIRISIQSCRAIRKWIAPSLPRVARIKPQVMMLRTNKSWNSGMAPKVSFSIASLSVKQAIEAIINNAPARLRDT